LDDIFPDISKEHSKMKHRTTTLLAVLLAVSAGLLVVSVPVFAHHGTSISYDMEKRVSVTGIVTQWRMTNPHAQLFWDVTDEDGNVVHWSGEISAPFHLSKAGWSRNSIRPGDEVTVILSPSRAGTPTGVMAEVQLPDGRTMERDDGRER
jgi:hypothetical protein